MNAATDEYRDQLTLMKVRREVQRMIAVIAKFDGKLVQDVTDEALTEYIQRRGLILTPENSSPA